MAHQCSKCGLEQPAEAFYPRTPQNGGWRADDGQCWSSQCRTCTRARSAQWREQFNTREWKDKNNQKAREKNARIKDAVFGAYGGYRCVCCGETERLFLSLDHASNDGATFRRKTFGRRNAAGSTTYGWLYRNGFPPGYQVMCMNCQFGKRMNNGVCPHQTQGRSNDYPLVGVGSSGPKRIAPEYIRAVR